MSMRGSYQ